MKGILLSIVFSLFTYAVYGQYASQHVFICPGDTMRFKAEALNADSYSWYRNGQLIPGADSDVLTVTNMGHYAAIAINGGGCESDTSASMDVEERSPIANIDSAYVNGGRSVNIDVLNNDIAMCWPFNKKTVQIVQFPTKGRIQVDASGMINYTANVQSGTDEFAYNVKDESGMVTNTAAVNVMIISDCAEVYPNPTINNVYVNVLNPAINILRVVDLTGHILFTENAKLPTSTIDLSGYPSGVYILQLLENNTVDCIYKVIKKTN